ncbi:unnamed protein product [Cylicocyclus nassatus]|uniref:Uncharacterized protein n=1 Tax=Cylicocyclus nassatus TaxID=53992 RepID=A0AA36GID3_CYLNA|nr:unnamed protein product [Cylicocyclus nassatus]
MASVVLLSVQVAIPMKLASMTIARSLRKVLCVQELKKVPSVKDNTSTPPVVAVAGDNDPKNYDCRALQIELDRM